jgi:hypothetical protein
MTLVALLMLMAGSSLVWRRPSGMLFIFHFTPRQLRRLRLEITRSYRISSYAISNIPPRPPPFFTGGTPAADVLARISHQLLGIGFKGAENGDFGLTLSR